MVGNKTFREPEKDGVILFDIRGFANRIIATMVAKRLLVLVLSFSTIIAFGYALGGLWGYVMGRGRPLVIAAGLAVGLICAAAALRIWRGYLEDIEREDRENEESGRHEEDD